MDRFVTGSRRLDLWLLAALALVIVMASPRLVVYSEMRSPPAGAERPAGHSAP